MAGLHGEFHHKLDAKGRLSLPAAFRKILSKSLMVTLSPKGECLYVFEPEGFDVWVESLFAKDGGFQTSNSMHAAQRKILNSRAIDIEVDGSNRIGVSSAQREAAGLDKEVVLIGDTDHFEIWDAKRWDDFCSSVTLDSLYVG
ncbi:MAG: division/cell wall cluster transcriptional repressor MraZ [Raoultibacter sp.]